jgi:hypothetical protein
MANEVVFEVRVESTDPSVVRAVESTLQPVSPEKEAPHRGDLMTLFKVITEAATMISSLIALWKALKSLQTPAHVKVENRSGAQLDLAAVSSETEIRDFVAASATK